MPKLSSLLIAAGAIFLSTKAVALMAPLEQSISQYQALLANPQLTTLLPAGDTIEEIVSNNKGFLILTQNYRLWVDVTYLPNQQPGPQKFALTFHKPTPVDTSPETTSN